MVSLLEGIVEDANRAYELQLQVREKLRSKENVDSYQAGLSSLSSGIRFAAVFGTLSKSQPFFKDAWKYLVDACDTTVHDDIGNDFNPETAYFRMRVFSSLSGLSHLLGKPGGDQYLQEALNALRPALGDEWVLVLKKRLSDGIEDLGSVSEVQLVFLSIVVLMSMSHESSDNQIISSKTVENALSLPVLTEYRELRGALGRMTVTNSVPSAAPESVLTYESAYRSVINLNSYQNGLVAGLTFPDAWLLAVIRENGNYHEGAVRLFSSGV
jgi:hypothetical protein